MDHNLIILDKLLSIDDNQSRSNKEVIFNQFLGKVNEKIPTKTFLEKLFSCSGNADRIDVVKEHFEWVQLDPEIKNKYKKNNQISSAFRNLGNSAFQKECNVDAVRLYNLALVFAVPGEAELALAYANRSAALHSMGLTEEAIQDIDLALSNNYPNESNKRKKLEDRKERFEAHLGERLKNHAFEQQWKEEISKRNSFYTDIFSLKSVNPLAPALEDSVDIKYNSAHGRLVVANRDIPVGETILVELPLVAVLDKALNWDVDHCHHCLKKNFRCIPCHHCIFTLYCDEKCRTEAEAKYHRYECPCLPELHCNLKDDLAKNFYLVFKLICRMGPNKLFSLFSKQKMDKNLLGPTDNNISIAGTHPATGVFDPGSYRAVYNMISTINPREGYYFILLSLVLSRTLDSNSDFFESLPSTTSTEQKLEFRDFIAQLIAHHFESFRRNVFGLSEIAEMDGVNLRTYMHSSGSKGLLDYGFEGFGVGAFPTLSLINHRCDQNVIRFTGKTFGTTAVVALKPVKKGEELFITYGPSYGSFGEHDATAKSRQAVLNIAYDFKCDCLACKHDWPGILDLARKETMFCCPLCASKFPHDTKTSAEFLKCRLTGKFKCRLCGHQHSQTSIEKEFNRHAKVLEVCQKLILSNSPLGAISALKSAFNFFESTLCPPSYQSSLGPKLFREAVHVIIFFSNPKL